MFEFIWIATKQNETKQSKATVVRGNRFRYIRQCGQQGILLFRIQILLAAMSIFSDAQQWSMRRPQILYDTPNNAM